MTAGLLEITDLLWPVDAGGTRLPALRAEVLGQLAGRGQHRAARIVARMPAAGGVLGWRQRYLASAVILGPLTLLRPAVAAAGAAAAAVVTRDAAASACAGLAVLAVLAVEPATGRRWYAPRPGR